MNTLDANTGALVVHIAPWLLAAAAVVLLVIAVVVRYWRGYRDPMVSAIRRDPKALYSLAPDLLPETERRLRLIGQINEVVDALDLPITALGRIRTWLDATESNQAQQIAMRLGAKCDAIDHSANAGEPTIWRLSFHSFPLRLNTLALALVPASPIDPESRLRGLRDRLDKIPAHGNHDLLLLIVSPDGKTQQAMNQRSQERWKRLIAPAPEVLTHLLLFPEPEEVLAHILAERLTRTDVSPYQRGGPVFNPRMFFGRSALVQRIVRRMPLSFVILGAHQVGKSSLLRALEREIARLNRIQVRYIHLSGVDIKDSLCNALNLKPGTSLQLIESSLVWEGRSRPFLFLIDESDLFVVDDAAKGYEMLRWFRSLSQSRVAEFCLAGGWLLSESLRKAPSIVYNHMEVFLIGEIEWDACLEMVTRPLGWLGLSLESQALAERLVRECGQQASLIAQVCQELISLTPSQQHQIRHCEIDAAFRNSRIRDAWLSNCRTLSPEPLEQIVDQVVIWGTANEESFRESDIRSIFGEAAPTIDPDLLERSLRRLQFAQILKIQNDLYSFRVPLQQQFLRQDDPQIRLGFVLSKYYQLDPLVGNFSQHMEVLYDLPLVRLRDIVQRRLLARSLDDATDALGLPRASLERVSAWLSAPAAEQARQIAERLEATWVPLEPDGQRAEPPVWRLGLQAFPLNLSTLALTLIPTGSSSQADPEGLLQGLRERLDAVRGPGTGGLPLLIFSADSEMQRDLNRRTAERRDRLIAPAPEVLTRLLLSPEPALVLAAVLAARIPRTELSPYQTGGGVQDPRMFFGRAGLLDHIVNRDPGNYLIVGGRQVGKSSLLQAVARALADSSRVQVHYCALGGADLAEPMAAALGLAAGAVLADIEALLHRSGGARPRVLLIDESDAFVRADADQDYAVLKRLRGLSESGLAYFSFAGYWTLFERSVLDFHSPLKNFGELIQVEELEWDACLELVRQPLGWLGLQLASAALAERLVRDCGQRANLIAMACHQLVARVQPDQREIGVADLEAVLASERLRDELLGNWHALIADETEQRLDRMAVYASVDWDAFGYGELAARLAEAGLAVDPERLERSLRRLRLAFVLGLQDGRYRYRVPLQQRLIRQDAPGIRLRQEVAIQNGS